MAQKAGKGDGKSGKGKVAIKVNIFILRTRMELHLTHFIHTSYRLDGWQRNAKMKVLAATARLFLGLKIFCAYLRLLFNKFG